MAESFYCPKCGTVQALGVGLINCRRCGGIGLRGFDKRPRRVRCPEDGCDFRGWDDGGVNDDLARHSRREHQEVNVTVRLTDPQRRLLEEIREAGVLYIGRHMRYARTIQALADKGVVTCVERDHSRHAHDGWSVTKRDSEPPRDADREPSNSVVSGRTYEREDGQ